MSEREYYDEFLELIQVRAKELNQKFEPFTSNQFNPLLGRGHVLSADGIEWKIYWNSVTQMIVVHTAGSKPMNFYPPNDGVAHAASSIPQQLKEQCEERKQTAQQNRDSV
jgi:hypothetical protein